MKYLITALLAIVLSGCNREPTATDTLQLDQLRGQWVVINYWAQWCKPCIREIPELNALDQSSAQVTVLGVNFDGATGDELQRQIHDLGIEFPILPQDPAPQLGVSRPQVLPTTLLIDPAGVLSETLIGPQTLASLKEAMSRSTATDTDNVVLPIK